ncbi:flavin-containing amine oxidoreductase-domain containing protein [Microdochium trichocladiopsis]|uniref:Flavin-containing amine oxidoreductase-domain containing protein n=1 Tax=Microdochium trichocladiopsis TaxID=1682393 RepID=A0A9P8YAM5_9PEZI|nr:flavin-containing amine oxidoreductase-domain containing protein [Microdochium trichocladiopsis]KAH7034539.1 flavin-containing amine oxidoreductase-domain containing protein [Microdochium trichocladiopsis]
MKCTIPLAPLLLSSAVSAASLSSLPVELETRSELDSRLANVHITRRGEVQGAVTYTYGACTSLDKRDAHHTISRAARPRKGVDSRLVWVAPEDVSSGGCISAWDSTDKLVGRSSPQHFTSDLKRRKRSGPSSIEMNREDGFDTWGPWFDGVALLEAKALADVDVAAAKSKTVGIAGAGMSGLMTWLVLHQSGFTNLTILEAGQRLGGRVRTEYLTGGPFDYSYQEMGPMRFPKEITIKNQTYNITDHQLVFQLAAELNELNNHAANWSVDFIPWIQSTPNGLSYKNGFKLPDTGMPPTLAQIKANSSLGGPPMIIDAATQTLQEKIDAITSDEDLMIAVATNMHKAHSEFLAAGLGGKGGDSWSEFGYMVNYLNATLNSTAIVGGDSSSFWGTIYDNVYFSASAWRTIDGGLSRLPAAFHPLVDGVTRMGNWVDGFSFDSCKQKVSLSLKNKKAEEFDYAIIAMPFSQVRKWRLPQWLPSTITSAIKNLPMGGACKVALEYRTRFWEHLENPIIGGCSTTTDIPGVGSVCYPSGNINGTGPATILASYASGDWATRWLSFSEEEHVQYMVDAMAEIHGDVASREYTGKYNRKCWFLDPLASGSWAEPEIGQHQLYLPEYFKTYNNIIFVGEQTSYTHAWIASALESGVRGAVQLLLELGLVDEAKAAVTKWMARWIEV